jgi:type II secretory ATPase GspE/PulE/Tfp pilus assembly ATPase PilB-like protein
LIGLVLMPMAEGFAANIKLLNGDVYPNVTILGRVGDIVEVQTQFGRVDFPVANIDSIDGVSLHGTATAAAGAASPGFVAPGLVVPPTGPAQPVVPPTAPSLGAPATAPIPGIQMTPPTPANTTPPAPQPPASAPDASAQPSAAGALLAHPYVKEAPTWPAVEYRPNMDAVILAFAAFAAMWIASVGAVQRSLYDRRQDPRLWSAITMLLPGIGYVIYHAVLFSSTHGGKKAAVQNANEKIASREKALTKSRQGLQFLDDDRKAIIIRDQTAATGLEHANEVLEEAMMERASDVHIDPAEDVYLVRFRIDGIMQPRMNYDRDMGMRIVAALKSLAQIDVAEKRKAQDGRFRVRTEESDVDFRVATANSIYGEKLVIRILNRKSGLLTLAELGMPEEMLEEFSRVIHSRNGIILATGPTGSGKTSTLYSALSQLDATRLNVMTIEDPVEYGLAGATQIPVNPKAGITFESGLRSILRQDPDVIFVGEMRDAEAAQVALRAALTGHLVFSSLHTRDAVGTIVRLEEMGMDRHLLSSSLLVVIAQRLVRVLCPACRVPYACKADELAEIGIELPEGETVFAPGGCKECASSGYLGRTGIFEMMVFDEVLRKAVNAGTSEGEFTDLAKTRGFASFRVNGAHKVLLGITSVEEVLQAS